MSNALFPSLPGLKWDITREYMESTKVHKAASGASTRASFYTAPLRKWTLAYEFLRQRNSLAELETLVGFHNRRNGRGDSFLYKDPDDCAVTDHGFGLGNGTTASFQLQRRQLGREVVNALIAGDPSSVTSSVGTSTLLSVGINNLADAAWTKQAGVVYQTLAGFGPDGSLGAALVDFTAAATAQGYYQAVSVPQQSQGGAIVGSVWLKGELGGEQVEITNPFFAGVAVVCTLTTSWQRFSFTDPAFNSTGHGVWVRKVAASPSHRFYAFGHNVTVGAVLLPTFPSSASASRTPAYWPASSDGFEPIYNLDPSNPLRVYQTTWQGRIEQFPFARTNNLLRSQDLTNATWSKEGGVTITATIAAPDGSTNAQRIVPTSGGTGVTQNLSFNSANGQAVTITVWLRAASATTATLIIGRAGGSGDFETLTFAVDTIWRRYSFTHSATWTGTGIIALHIRCATTTAIEVFGAQLEKGRFTGAYIPTTTAAVTVTDYTVSSSGLVTLASAPLAGAVLTWSGGFFWRVCFEDDKHETTNFMWKLYSAKKVVLEQVR